MLVIFSIKMKKYLNNFDACNFLYQNIKMKKYLNNFDACNFLYQNEKVPE